MKYTNALVMLAVSRKLAEAASRNAEAEAREVLSNYLAENTPTDYRPTIEEKIAEYIKHAPEKAWERKYQEALLVYGHNLKSVCSILPNKEGRETFQQYDEGLITFREAINWIWIKLGNYSLIELGRTAETVQ